MHHDHRVLSHVVETVVHLVGLWIGLKLRRHILQLSLLWFSLFLLLVALGLLLLWLLRSLLSCLALSSSLMSLDEILHLVRTVATGDLRILVVVNSVVLVEFCAFLL